MVKISTKVKTLIDSTITYLNSYYKIEQVILFGSQVAGRGHRYSDIDLMVVSSDFEKKKLNDLLNVFSKISLELSPDIEIHPFTPKDIKEARPTNFIGHILRTGRVVYRKHTT
jgi:predicted nucleotidyltransferase